MSQITYKKDLNKGKFKKKKKKPPPPPAFEL